MKLIAIYQCLCDETRLRILSLLSETPLCVCYIQSILRKPQVIVSQHLAYLKRRKLAVATRHGQWMVYALPASRPRELDANLRCLQDCVQTEPVFKRDRARLRKLMRRGRTCIPVTGARRISLRS